MTILHPSTRKNAAASATRPERRFARFSWGVLALNILVILWGAYVRATGSGAGCGNHWPLCNGQVVLRSPALATLIEFTHRVTSGLALLLVAWMLVWALRVFPKGHPARPGAILSAVFICTEALLGAGLVLLQHVSRNASVSRAWSLSAHLINTLLLAACLTLTAWWASGGAPVRFHGAPAWRTAAGVTAVMLMGVSGALAALGDTLFPAASLAEGLRQDFAPSVHLFVRLRVLHPFFAVAGGIWLLYDGVSAAVREGSAAVHRLARFVAAMVLLQLLAGVVNLLLLAPVWMQIVHLLLAEALWVGYVLFCAARLAGPHRPERPAQDEKPLTLTSI